MLWHNFHKTKSQTSHATYRISILQVIPHSLLCHIRYVINSQNIAKQPISITNTFKVLRMNFFWKLEWHNWYIVFDHIFEVVLVELWSDMFAPPIISWLRSRRRSFHMRELVGGWCEVSRLRENLVDELRVVDDASSSVFEDPPPPNTAFNPPGLMPSTKPGLSFPPKSMIYFC